MKKFNKIILYILIVGFIVANAYNVLWGYKDTEISIALSNVTNTADSVTTDVIIEGAKLYKNRDVAKIEYGFFNGQEFIIEDITNNENKDLKDTTVTIPFDITNDSCLFIRITYSDDTVTYSNFVYEKVPDKVEVSNVDYNISETYEQFMLTFDITNLDSEKIPLAFLGEIHCITSFEEGVPPQEISSGFDGVLLGEARANIEPYTTTEEDYLTILEPGETVTVSFVFDEYQSSVIVNSSESEMSSNLIYVDENGKQKKVLIKESDE